VLKAALGGALAVGAVGGVVRRWPGDAAVHGSAHQPALELAAEGSDQVSAVEVGLDDDLLRRGADLSQWETPALSSSLYSMVGLTWEESLVSPVLDIRARSGGRWGEWRGMSCLHDGPDRGSGEGAARGGTDLAWIGPSDGVQVRVTGGRPRGLRLVLLHPWTQPEDDLETPDGRRRDRRGVGVVPRPEVRGRRRWGADESWRDGRPRYNRTIQQVHVHHTANSNDYHRRDVPALIRGMYRYHTRYLGWSDIGYNFVVDRFGRIWTGRAGGAGRPVRGAHTLGFNATSTGISVIGNFDVASPSPAVLDAVAAVAAWKLRPFGRDPRGAVRVWSEGSDRYRRGKVVALPVVDGHRDTNDTACPGAHLYQALPEIRRRAGHLVEWYSKVHVLESATLKGEPALGATLTVEPGRYTPADASLRFVWLRNGSRIQGAGGATYVVRPADAGARLSVRVVARTRGLQPARERLDAATRAKAPAKVSLEAVADRGGRLLVRIHVASPPGVAAVPRRRVVVKVAGRRAVVRLSKGRGTASFGSSTPLEPGRYRVRARYFGDRAHDPARAKVRVRIRR
jgi:hypothetical protein